MAIDYEQYGTEFIRKSKILRHGYGRCALCGVENYKPNPRTKSKVVLTAHHIDEDYTNNDTCNLIPLCQQCHFAAHRKKTPHYKPLWMHRFRVWLMQEMKTNEDLR